METPPPNVLSDNLYERLGLGLLASAEDVETAWQARVGELHAQGGAKEAEGIANVNEAKAILSSAKLRGMYDKDGLASVRAALLRARKAREAEVAVGAGVAADFEAAVPERIGSAGLAAMATAAAVPMGTPGAPVLTTRREPEEEKKKSKTWMVGVAAWMMSGKTEDRKVAVVTPKTAVAGNQTTTEVPPAPEKPVAEKPTPVAKPAGKPAGGGGTAGLVIVDAQWGASGKMINVTKILQEHIKNGKLDMVADNVVLGDPAPQQPKSVVITYEVGGKRTTKTIKEGAKISLAAPPAKPAPKPGTP